MSKTFRAGVEDRRQPTKPEHPRINASQPIMNPPGLPRNVDKVDCFTSRAHEPSQK